jgi:uncharacterized protein YqhQ
MAEPQNYTTQPAPGEQPAEQALSQYQQSQSTYQSQALQSAYQQNQAAQNPTNQTAPVKLPKDRSTMYLVIGILSLFFSLVTGILNIIFSRNLKTAWEQNDVQNILKYEKYNKICAIIALAVLICLIVLIVLLVVLGVMAASTVYYYYSPR